MQWQSKSRLRKDLKESLWIVPALFAVLGVALAQIDLAFLDGHVSPPRHWALSSETASVVLSAVISAMAGLTGLVVAVAILIIQMATGTLSPRYMRIWFRDSWQKAALAGFLGTLAFAYTLLHNTSERSVPSFGVALTGIFVLVSLVVFLRYVDRFAHLLSPVALSAYVANAGAKVLTSRRLAAAELNAVVSGEEPGPAEVLDRQTALAVHSDRNGVVQGADGPGLLKLATRHDCVLLVRCPIGEFVAPGDTLVEVLGGDPPPSEDSLRGRFLTGAERAFEQDPSFALRIIVDIAIRALSPAVNDPTTGVQLLDYIEALLRLIGERELADRYELRDAGGRTRIILSARAWDEYLRLGVTEIMEYGSTSVQVTRRLRALLESLLESVHPANREAVRVQLGLLDAALAEEVHDVARREYASKPDRQGIGGPKRLDGLGTGASSQHVSAYQESRLSS